jgi:hypothetical protein
MKLEYQNNQFVISNLDYEMVRVLINGITCERKNLIEKISYLTTCLYKDYSEKQKDEFRNQIDFLKNHNDKLNDIVNECNLILEEIPL